MLDTAGSASATTIDFAAIPTGTYSSLIYGPVTVSFLDGSGNFEVQNQTPGLPSGHMLISYFTNAGSGSFQATFAGGASFVSIDVGDYSPSDDDEGHLRAYDVVNNLLDSDFFLVPASGPVITPNWWSIVIAALQLERNRRLRRRRVLGQPDLRGRRRSD